MFFKSLKSMLYLVEIRWPIYLNNILCLYFEKLLGQVLSKQICNILLNLSSVAIYASEFPLLLVSACPCHHIASTMFKTRCGVYQVMRCSFLSPYHSHHSCISQSWFYLSKDFFSRTVQALLVIFFSKVSSWVWPVFCTL